jgi:serine/threonine-protein kinase HipA
MGRKAEIYNNGVLAGTLEKTDDHEYIFRYDTPYFNDSGRYAISLSLPKTLSEYRSKTLFPFFYGLLSEGVNKQTQCRLLRIDERDHFSLLLNTAHSDTIGSVTVKEITT